MDKNKVENCLAIMDTKKSGQGGTEERIEKMVRIMMTGFLHPLKQHANHCDDLEKTLLATFIAKYTDWCYDERYDNAPIVALLTFQKALVDGAAAQNSGISTDVDSISKMLGSVSM